MSAQTNGSPLQATPNAENYVLQADALRRRQLETALLHGSGQTWRERRRVWPAAIGGIIAIVIIIAAVAIMGAFHQQQLINERQERERQSVTGSGAEPFRNQAGAVDTPRSRLQAVA